MKKPSAALIMAVVASLFLLTATVFAAPVQGGAGKTVHVGWVTDYQPGVSITIQTQQGELYTFALTPNIMILPMAGSREITVGSRVTILARYEPSMGAWSAFGIVVHPWGSGAGAQPPTLTPTFTPTATPTFTPTNTPTDTPTNTPTNTPTSTPTSTATSTPTLIIP